MSQPARSTSVRRPLPALIFLAALVLLTVLVWWRVIHRSDGGGAKASGTPSPRTSCSSAAIAASTVLPANADVTVQVLNSTDKGGLAAATGAALTNVGFKQAAAPNNDKTTRAPVAGVAELRFGPAGKLAADVLSFYFPGAVTVPDQRATAVVDVAVGAKFVAIATPDAAAAAMKSAKVTQAAAGAKLPTPTATPKPSC